MKNHIMWVEKPHERGMLYEVFVEDKPEHHPADSRCGKKTRVRRATNPEDAALAVDEVLKNLWAELTAQYGEGNLSWRSMIFGGIVIACATEACSEYLAAMDAKGFRYLQPQDRAPREVRVTVRQIS